MICAALFNKPTVYNTATFNAAVFSYTGIPHISRWSDERAAHASCSQQWRRPLTRAWRLNGPNFKWILIHSNHCKHTISQPEKPEASLYRMAWIVFRHLEPLRRESRVWQTDRQTDGQTDRHSDSKCRASYVARPKSVQLVAHGVVTEPWMSAWWRKIHGVKDLWNRPR